MMAGTLHPTAGPGPGRSVRSASWWMVAAVVAVAGLIAGTVWAALNVLGLTHRPADFPHAMVPGSLVVELADGTRVDTPVVVNVAGPASGAVNALAGVGADFLEHDTRHAAG